MNRIPSYVASAAFAIAALTAGSSICAEDHDHDQDKNHDKGLRQELNALKAQVSALQKQVGDLQTSNATLQMQLTNAKNVLALAPFVNVDPNPEIGVAGP